MLPAARVTDQIVSTATQGVPTPIVPPGAPTVLVGGLPAARVGDSCGVDAIVKGSLTVLIGGMPAARMGDICLIRGMSTGNTVHERARAMMHTGYNPNGTVVYPSIGNIASCELGAADA